MRVATLLMEVVDNVVAQLYVAGDVTAAIVSGDGYTGVYSFNSAEVRNDGKVVTAECVLGTAAVDANSSQLSGVCP